MSVDPTPGRRSPDPRRSDGPGFIGVREAMARQEPRAEPDLLGG